MNICITRIDNISVVGRYAYIDGADDSGYRYSIASTAAVWGDLAQRLDNIRVRQCEVATIRARLLAASGPRYDTIEGMMGSGAQEPPRLLDLVAGAIDARLAELDDDRRSVESSALEMLAADATAQVLEL